MAIVNDINKKKWKEYDHIMTDSLWIINRRDNSGTHAADYWGNYIPQIPHQMMERYTKKGDTVFDPFLGSGTTLIEAQRMGRNGIGIDLQADVAKMAAERIAGEENTQDTFQKIHVGDSVTSDYPKLLKECGVEQVQLVMMHPPYFDIIKFSEDQEDLSNASDVDTFIEQLGTISDNCHKILEDDRFLVLVIGDKYTKGEWVPLGFLAMNRIQESGFSLKSIVVKNFEETAGKKNAKQLWRYRALVGGFYVFKHEYIFVFQKK